MDLTGAYTAHYYLFEYKCACEVAVVEEEKNLSLGG
jgi:hypothetical protein